MDEFKNWYQTEEGKQEFLDQLNHKFSFDTDGNIYCRECKNETIACVCMGEDEE